MRKFKQWLKARREKELQREAQDLYQLRERGGELWLTYRNEYVCPCRMLNEQPTDVVQSLRAWWLTYQNQ